jgi:hypothetical protein
MGLWGGENRKKMIVNNTEIHCKKIKKEPSLSLILVLGFFLSILTMDLLPVQSGSSSFTNLGRRA